MFSQEVIKLAKPLVEAIKKIAEKVGKECPVGTGFYVSHSTNCPICNGTGKVKGKWEWKPVVGEQFIGKEGIPIVIAGIIDVPLAFGTENRRLQYLSMDRVKEVFVKDVIPLLRWERIEEILEGMGYWLGMNKPLDKYLQKGHMKVGCRLYRIGKDNYIASSLAKTRTEAVYKAVIELREE